MAIVFTYTVSTNTVVVTGGTSGTPATFSDFVTADRAGTGTSLRAATAGTATVTLTYQIRPVELRALVVKCIVAAKTAEADFIFITGTDAWDAAQTESIDVTAGNGTYTSTKRFRTITKLDCSDNAAGGGTAWADGTIAVTQDIWGVIWNLGNGQYNVDSIFVVGDASTSTYFLSTKEEVYFTSYITTSTMVTTNATLTIGVKDATNQCRNGCMWNLKTSNSGWASLTFNGTFNLYGSSFYQSNSVGPYYFNMGSANFDLQNSTIQANGVLLNGYAGTIRNCITFYINKTYGNGWQDIGSGTTFYNNKVYYEACGIFFSYHFGGKINSPIISNVTNELGTYAITVDCNVINPTYDSAVSVSWGGGAGNTKSIYEKYTCDINVCDKSGVAISGAVIDCEDQTATAVWTAGTVTTDASGNITQQSIPKIRYYYSGGAATTTYSPHKFTISKAGYETLVLENITVDGPIDWHLELQDEVVYPAEDDVRDAVDYGEGGTALTGNLELPLPADVQDGVGYGSSGTEHTGTFSAPLVSDVENGVGYGAGGVEFIGTFTDPGIVNVESGVQYGGGGTEFTGVFVAPHVSHVKEGIGYGSNSTEFTGTLKMPIPTSIQNFFDGPSYILGHDNTLINIKQKTYEHDGVGTIRLVGNAGIETAFGPIGSMRLAKPKRGLKVKTNVLEFNARGELGIALSTNIELRQIVKEVDTDMSDMLFMMSL